MSAAKAYKPVHGGYPDTARMASTDPKPYRCPLAVEASVKTLFTVVDTSDDNGVVATFRNRALAEKLADASPAYEVREHTIRT